MGVTGNSNVHKFVYDNSKENSKTPYLCEGNPSVASGFSLQKDGNPWIHRWAVNSLHKDHPDSKVHGANMGPSGADRTQVGHMLDPWTRLFG